jgi:hypothetical protein
MHRESDALQTLAFELHWQAGLKLALVGLPITHNGKLKPQMNANGREFSKSSIYQQLHPVDE